MSLRQLLWSHKVIVTLGVYCLGTSYCHNYCVAWKLTVCFIYFVDRCAQSKVLVHCKMGISRSASTVIQLFLCISHHHHHTILLASTCLSYWLVTKLLQYSSFCRAQCGRSRVCIALSFWSSRLTVTHSGHHSELLAGDVVEWVRLYHRLSMRPSALYYYQGSRSSRQGGLCIRAQWNDLF